MFLELNFKAFMSFRAFYPPVILKVVSSENKGGSKMVLIDVYGPGTVALGVFL
jgi:hypothetical protein